MKTVSDKEYFDIATIGTYGMSTLYFKGIHNEFHSSAAALAVAESLAHEHEKGLVIRKIRKFESEEIVIACVRPLQQMAPDAPPVIEPPAVVAPAAPVGPESSLPHGYTGSDLSHEARGSYSLPPDKLDF